MKRAGLLAAAMTLFGVAAWADAPEAETVQVEVVEAVEVVSEKIPKADTSEKFRFSWGAEAGAAIDLTGNDMSSIDFNAVMGVKWKYLKFLGVGVQADITVSNPCRYYPLFLILRTNFRSSESLLFWDLRVGASVNYLEDNLNQTGAYLSTGLGINLARGDKFSSHMIIGYNFRQRKDVLRDETVIPFDNLHYAAVRIGLCF